MFTYKIADRDNLERIWDKNIERHPGDSRWENWKIETISNYLNDRSTTFLVLAENEPIGEGSLLWSPDCNAIAGRKKLADGDKIANINALRIEKSYEGQGHISHLIKMMEQVAKDKGIERLTIGVEAKETRNLAIYLHLGFCNFVMPEIEENELILYYEKYL